MSKVVKYDDRYNPHENKAHCPKCKGFGRWFIMSEIDVDRYVLCNYCKHENTRYNEGRLLNTDWDIPTGRRGVLE